MGKGDYLGGSTVVRLNGAYLGTKKPKLAKPTEIDSHFTQKLARDEARAKVEGPKRKRVKTPKAEQRADKAARKNFQDAPKEVFVQHKVGGVTVSTRTVKQK